MLSLTLTPAFALAAQGLSAPTSIVSLLGTSAESGSVAATGQFILTHSSNGLSWEAHTPLLQLRTADPRATSSSALLSLTGVPSTAPLDVPPADLQMSPPFDTRTSCLLPAPPYLQAPRGCSLSSISTQPVTWAAS